MLLAKKATKLALLNLLVFFLFVAQVGTGFAANVSPADRAAFLQSIEKTKGPAKASKVCKSLLAVVPPPGYQGTWPEDKINTARLHGGRISWEGNPGKSRVRVAAFMSRSDYETYYRDNLESGEHIYTLRKSLWVTVVPELRNWFRHGGPNTCPPSRKRVVKLLGLNPGRDYDVIVEMFVDQKDLFRPTPDPEITDHRAEIAVKARDGSWIFPNPFMNYCTEKLFVDGPTKAPLSYQEWFTKNAQDAYDVDIDKGWGVPWTRLGYTYDWGNPANPVGASEFMIRVHPSPTGVGGEVPVTLIQAIRIYAESPLKPSNWKNYFRCSSRAPVVNGYGLENLETQEEAFYLGPEMEN
ncbi:MAG: hypothetical protein AB9866_21145 [Syntrophobacteraceae bacterium]